MATKGASFGGLGAATTGIGLLANLMPSKFDRSGKHANVPQRVGANIVKYGVAQTNLGLVIINSPKIMQQRYALGSIVAGAGSFIEAFNVPGKSLQTSDVRRFGVGPLLKSVVGSTGQNTTTLTILGDAQGKFYNFYYLWLNSIVRTEGMDKSWESPLNDTYPYEVSYFDQYASTIIMNECNVNMNVVTETSLLGAFPISISEKQMNWNNTGLMSFTVEIAYRYVSIKDVETDVITFERPPVKFSLGIVAALIKAGNAIQLAQSIKSSGGSSAAALVAVGASALSAF